MKDKATLATVIIDALLARNFLNANGGLYHTGFDPAAKKITYDGEKHGVFTKIADATNPN